jgi:hypothetical protein
LVPRAAAVSLAFLLGCGGRTGLLIDSVDVPPVEAAAPIFPILALVPTPASGEGTYDYALSPFDPTSGVFAPLEPIPCLKAFGDRAISMAIDCGGQVYIQFARNGLWRVTTSSSNCARTPFNAAAQSLQPDLALGFATNANGGETLYYVATDTSSVPASPSFGTLDTSDFQAHRIGPFSAGPVAQTHLGGAPDGRLFAVTGNDIDQVDESTGSATLDEPVSASDGPVQAFAFWHGSFYLFRLLPAETTSVVSWTPGESSLASVGSTSRTVVAASASVCQ